MPASCIRTHCLPFYQAGGLVIWGDNLGRSSSYNRRQVENFIRRLPEQRVDKLFKSRQLCNQNDGPAKESIFLGSAPWEDWWWGKPGRTPVQKTVWTKQKQTKGAARTRRQLTEIDPITSGVIKRMETAVLMPNQGLQGTFWGINKGSSQASFPRASFCPLLFMIHQEQRIKFLSMSSKIGS